MDRANAKNGRRQAMAEMTAAECVCMLKPRGNVMHFGEDFLMIKPSECDQLAALIEQQAQEIERQTKAIGIFMSANQSPETYRQVKQPLEDACKDAQQKR